MLEKAPFQRVPQKQIITFQEKEKVVSLQNSTKQKNPSKQNLYLVYHENLFTIHIHFKITRDIHMTQTLGTPKRPTSNPESQLESTSRKVKTQLKFKLKEHHKALEIQHILRRA